MLDFAKLPSLDTVKGKLFWAGVFGILTVSCGAGVVYQTVRKVV